MLVTTEKLRTAGFDVRVFSHKELARFLGFRSAQGYEIRNDQNTAGFI